MSEGKTEVAKSFGLWKTGSALVNHAVLWFLCVAQLMAVPRFVSIYEAFDYRLPWLTIVVIKIHAACPAPWIVLPLLTLALFAADALVLFLLWRIPPLRILGTIWYFTVMLGLLFVAGVIAAGLLLPLSALNEQLLESVS